jgi:hypothetical protein
LFDGVAHLLDHRLKEAQDLLASLRAALQSDEYVEALESHLDADQTKAIRLLAWRPPTPEPTPTPTPITPTPTPTGGTSWRRIEEGRGELTTETCEAELASLATLLRNREGRWRLVLSWSLEREESP